MDKAEQTLINNQIKKKGKYSLNTYVNELILDRKTELTMKYTFFFSLLFLLTNCSIAQRKQSDSAYINQDYLYKVQQSEKIIVQLMNEKQIPGLSISIASKDKFIWMQSYGFADLENKTPITIDSKFRIGSISKTLTAIAIAKLIDNGQLNLSDDIRKYVPYFPEKKYPITIGHLARHTAGIRDYNYANGEFLSNQNFKSVEESISVFKNDTLLFEPGTKYSYSTYGYVLLSAVIEGVTKINFVDYMKDSILDPMNLYNTVPDYNYDIIEHRVRFYDNVDGEIVNGYYVNNSNKWAGGGYLSTSYDLALMAQNLLSNQILSESTKQLLWIPSSLKNGEKTNYGIGWRIDTDDKGRKYVHHGGSSIGGRSFLMVYPNEELIIAITCNLSTNFDQYALFDVVELFIEEN